MKLRNVARAALALTLTGGLALAAGTATPWPGQSGSTHAKTHAKQASGAKPVVRSHERVSLVIPTTGLTEDNAAQVKTALEGLSSSDYRCPACKAEYAAPGECTKCKQALALNKLEILDRVTTAPDQHQIAIETGEGMPLRLSEVERALSAKSVQIDQAQLTLPGRATLIVSHAAGDQQAKEIEKELAAEHLFDHVSARFHDYRTEVQVTAGATAPTRAKVEAALAKAGTGFKLSDVVWNQST